MIAPWPGVEPVTFRSRVQPRNAAPRRKRGSYGEMLVVYFGHKDSACCLAHHLYNSAVSCLLVNNPSCSFYRAMHRSARRGITIACRPSFCPSVTLVDQDHIGWNSWKLIARTISPTPSLFVAHRQSTYSQGNMEKFGGDKRWGGNKWCAGTGAQKRQYL